MVPSFRIIKYVKYEKRSAYGEPKSDQFVFTIEDNMAHSNVRRDIKGIVASFKKGDNVLLSWNHGHVTTDGGSGPARPIVKVEKIAPAGTQAWMEQVDRVVGTWDALDHGPTIGSEQWMIAVNRKLGVHDADGHGSDLHTGQWRSAIHRKAFGLEPESRIVVVYHLADGKELRVTYDNLRQTVTLHTYQKDITLPHAVFASGARYAAGDEEFWNKGAYAIYPM